MDDVDSVESPIGSTKEERDKRILEAFRTQSAERVALDFGISAASVRKIALMHGFKKRNLQNEEDLPKVAPRSSINNTHKILGVRFGGFIELKKMRTNKYAAEELGWSTQKLASTIRGEYSLTLTDLSVMAKYMDVTLSKLLEDL